MEWNEETANIIYASNDGYAGHLAASMYSLLDNNRNIRKGLLAWRRHFTGPFMWWSWGT